MKIKRAEDPRAFRSFSIPLDYSRPPGGKICAFLAFTVWSPAARMVRKHEKHAFHFCKTVLPGAFLPIAFLRQSAHRFLKSRPRPFEMHRASPIAKETLSHFLCPRGTILLCVGYKKICTEFSVHFLEI